MANEVETKTLNFFVAGVREFIGSFRGENIDPGRMIAAIFFMGLGLLFTGAEAMKIAFRRNFEKGTVGIVQIVIASIIFIGWGVGCFVPSTLGMGTDTPETPFSFVLAGLFYLIFGIWILIKGIREWKLSEDAEEYEGTEIGESTFLGFLRSPDFNEYKIRQIAEPFAVLALGLLFSGINLFMGIPLLFCAISLFIFSLISYKITVETKHLTAKPGGALKNSKPKSPTY